MKISYQDLKEELKRVLLNLSFTEEKAEQCAAIFAGNSLDGVYSHGVNRFPVFVQYVKNGFIDTNAEPSLVKRNGGNGNMGWSPGTWNVYRYKSDGKSNFDRKSKWHGMCRSKEQQPLDAGWYIRMASSQCWLYRDMFQQYHCKHASLGW
jgi:hypothetical protein